jgi:hypothetical protein
MLRAKMLTIKRRLAMKATRSKERTGALYFEVLDVWSVFTEAGRALAGRRC